MAKNGNATTLKIVSILVTIGILAGGAIYGYASLNHEVVDNSEGLATMEPEVKQNTEHRHRFEEKVLSMEKNVEKILVIVQDLEK